MMKNFYKSLVACVQVIFFTAVVVNGWAVNASDPIHGTVVVSGSAAEVTWTIPEGNAYDIADLRVSPPGGGEVSMQQFYSSETPTFHPASGDGYYNFELTLLPALPPESEELPESEALLESEASPVTQMQAGGFRILNGALVSNEGTEEE